MVLHRVGYVMRIFTTHTVFYTILHVPLIDFAPLCGLQCVLYLSMHVLLSGPPSDHSCVIGFDVIVLMLLKALMNRKESSPFAIGKGYANKCCVFVFELWKTLIFAQSR